MPTAPAPHVCGNCHTPIFYATFRDCPGSMSEPDYDPNDDPTTWRHRGGYARCPNSGFAQPLRLLARSKPLHLDDPGGGEVVLIDVARERARAHDKHAPDSMEVRPWDDSSWLRVLVEEVGEVARVLNDAHHGGVIANPGSVDLLDNLYGELIQVAAMAAAWAHAVLAATATAEEPNP